MDRSHCQAGNIFFTLFGAVGLVGVLGAASMSVIKGPVRSMHNVTQRTIAENNMIAAGKLALMAATNQAESGDCDADGSVEPIPFSLTGTGPHPTGGGYLPDAIGAAKQDPWGSLYGYCAWDHGDIIRDGTCSDDAGRLSGAAVGDGVVLAVISSGPDRIFQTACGDDPDYVARPSGSDDIVQEYTYGEAVAASGGLWNLQSDNPETAEIAKNLEVKDSGGDVVFGVDSSTDPAKPSIKVDYIQQLSAGAVTFLSNIALGDRWLSGDGDDEGLYIDTDGNVGIAPGRVYQIDGQDFAGLGPRGNSTVVGLNAGGSQYQSAFGDRAGEGNTGFNQTVFGGYAGRNNTGRYQAAFGDAAGIGNTADRQSAFGSGAGRDNTGIYQSAFGDNAGGNNTAARQSAFGYYAGYGNTGENQVAFGYEAGRNNYGDNVIALGYQAGRNNTLDSQFIVQQRNVNITPLIQGDFASGNVGVGTAAPESALHVDGVGTFDRLNVRAEGSGFTGLHLYQSAWGSGNNLPMILWESGNPAITRVHYIRQSGNSLNFQSADEAHAGGGWPGTITAMTITGDGNVIVGGDVTADSFFYSSDARLKENIETLTSRAVEDVYHLRGVSFDWKKDSKPDIGLIAQEVEEHFPELVAANDNGMKSVKYGNLVALLLEALKRQQGEIDALRDRLDEVEGTK